MGKPEKSQLLIAGMCVILFCLLFFDEKKDRSYLGVFSEKETETSVSSLIAPDRTVFPLKEGQRVCYLTFDDGPSENTEEILDILKAHGIKATFFVIGEEMTEERKETVQRIIEEGHAIGMHANVHEYEKLYAGLEAFLEDYAVLHEKLEQEYGVETALFRMPGGSVCSCLRGNGKTYIQEMEKRGFCCFDWNVSGEDSVGNPTAASIRENVLSKGLDCRRAIVLLHDSRTAKKTVEALPEIIEAFEKEGFSFDSLEHAESYVFPKSRT